MGKDLKGKELGEGIVQRKNGLYYARVKSEGKTIGRYFQKLAEAKRWRIEVKAKAEHGSIYSKKGMYLDAWFNYWIEEYKNDRIRTKTINDYKELYHNHISSHLGSMLINDIKSIHCNNVLNQMMRKGLADSTIKKVRTLMHSIFEYAYDNEMVEKNPISHTVTAKGTEKTEKYIMTITEHKLFLEKAKNTCHYTFFAFILQTGLRYAEMNGLKWSDIDIENRKMSIKRSVDWDKTEGRFIEKSPKSKAGYRTIPLTDKAIAILNLQKMINKTIPTVIGYHEYVFRNSNGVPNGKSTLNKSLKALSKKIGIPNISLHCLRHTFATRCIERGVNPKMLQKIMGHSKISLTMDIYAHATDESVISEFQKFEDVRYNKIG